MFNVNKPVYEAPMLAGAAIGGLIGSSGLVAGLTVLGGMAIGAIGGTLLGGLKQKAPKIQVAQNQEKAAVAQTPALPPATPIPAAPLTPGAGPKAPGILKPDDVIAPDIPIKERPQEPGEASPPTTEEIARGQLEKKRKGRLSTILTSPKSRLQEGEVQEGFERLGG